jgi:predicted metalloprotease with PDZ domain
MVSTVRGGSAVRFKVTADNLNAHLFHVTLTVKSPSPTQILSLPVWIPGSYLIREFSKNLQNLKVQQGRREMAVLQVGKAQWQVACDTAKPLVVTYEIYALDNSVRTAWLDASRGFFNGTSMFLRVEGQTDSVHELEIVAPPVGKITTKNWQLATALSPLKINKSGFGLYRAANYDELADCPVEMGAFWSGNFKACGVPHRFIVAGAPPTFDGERLLADVQKICEAEIRFWHPDVDKKSAKNKAPHNHYLFMLNVVDDGYGGLEHKNSTALICNRKDLPRAGALPPLSEGYTTLLGLISHEYFHTWNVKRLRPAELARYDYASENYTQLLWFFEGFTSYYDDLLLRRAGLIDDATYLKLLTKTVNQVLQTPGRHVQTVAQASFDAWVKYYRQDENTPNATVSYYTKGSLVALCLDLTLRSEGKTSLDAVMRGLWQRCQAGPMTQDDLLAVLQDLSGRSFAPELAHWVHSTADLPLEKLLASAGVALLQEPAQMAQMLGLRVVENNGVLVKMVLRGGAAELAGFAAGDEWLGVEVAANNAAKTNANNDKKKSAWRIQKLDDLKLYVGNTVAKSKPQKMTAIVARDKRLLNLSLQIPTDITTCRLAVRDAKAVGTWLA